MEQEKDKLKQRREEAFERKKENQKKRKKWPVVLKKVAVWVLLVCLVSGIGAVTFSNTAYGKRHLIVAKVADENISAAEYTFYYFSSFISYYQTMASAVGVDNVGINTQVSLDKQEYDEGISYGEYFRGQAESLLRFNHAFSEEAKASGMKELNDEYAAKLESDLKTAETQAKNNNMSLKRYLRNVYGKGINLDMYKEILTENYLARQFIDEHQEGVSYTDEEVNAYYEEHKDDIDVVDFRYETFYVNDNEENGELVSPEEAKEQAEAFYEKVNDEASFEEASTERNGSDKSKAKRFTKAIAAQLNEEAAEWLYDDERQVGDKELFVSEQGSCFVLYITKLPYKDEEVTRDVRHILLMRSSYENTEEARKAAEDLYAKWQENGATEDLFAEMAEAGSQDSGSKDNGGLYTGVRRGDTVDAFNDWLFDEARQPGDTDIIESEYGYHIMYYVGEAEGPAWFVSAKEALSDEDYATWYNSILEKYPFSVAEPKWLSMKLIDQPVIS